MLSFSCLTLACSLLFTLTWDVLGSFSLSSPSLFFPPCFFSTFLACLGVLSLIRVFGPSWQHTHPNSSMSALLLILSFVLVLAKYCFYSFLDMKTVQYLRLNLIRVTIRPLFPRHVLFLDLQKYVQPGFLNRPNCPWFSYFLNPAPTEFLTIAVCSRNMFRCRDFRVHSFKRSNIEYNFGTSGSHYLYTVYLNIFEWAFALFTFTFDFAITCTLC